MTGGRRRDRSRSPRRQLWTVQIRPPQRNSRGYAPSGASRSTSCGRYCRRHPGRRGGSASNKMSGKAVSRAAPPRSTEAIRGAPRCPSVAVPDPGIGRRDQRRNLLDRPPERFPPAPDPLQKHTPACHDALGRRPLDAQPLLQFLRRRRVDAHPFRLGRHEHPCPQRQQRSASDHALTASDPEHTPDDDERDPQD